MLWLLYAKILFNSCCVISGITCYKLSSCLQSKLNLRKSEVAKLDGLVCVFIILFGSILTFWMCQLFVAPKYISRLQYWHAPTHINRVFRCEYSTVLTRWHTLPFWDHRGGSSWPRGKRPVSRQERKARRWPPGGKWRGGRWIPSWLTRTSVPPQSAGMWWKNIRQGWDTKRKIGQKTHTNKYKQDKDKT